MKISVTERDKIILSTKQPREVGYAGACTSSDPASCWVTFGSGVPRTDGAGEARKGNTCFMKSSRLPDGSLSHSPEYIAVSKKGAPNLHREVILLPVLDSSNDNRISIGGFPGGDVASFTLHFSDGATAKFVDSGSAMYDQRQLDVDVALGGQLNIYRRKFLKSLAKSDGADRPS